MLEIKSCRDRAGYVYTLPTAEQILNFSSGEGGQGFCCEIDILMAKMFIFISE